MTDFESSLFKANLQNAANLPDSQQLNVLKQILRFFLLGCILNVKDANLNRFLSKQNLDLIPDFDVRGCLGGFAIHHNTTGITCLIRNRSSLDQSLYLQKFI